MASGVVVGVDVTPAYVRRTRQRAEESPAPVHFQVLYGDGYDLPFANGVLDFVWCARSLITLDDSLKALQEMRRVLRPGRMLAILENDQYLVSTWWLVRFALTSASSNC